MKNTFFILTLFILLYQCKAPDCLRSETYCMKIESGSPYADIQLDTLFETVVVRTDLPVCGNCYHEMTVTPCDSFTYYCYGVYPRQGYTEVIFKLEDDYFCAIEHVDDFRFILYLDASENRR